MAKLVGLVGRRAALLSSLAALTLVGACSSSSGGAAGAGSASPPPTASSSSSTAGGSSACAGPTSSAGSLALSCTGRAATSLAGHWTVASGSVAGYRVNETFLGQSSDAVARTSALTGGTDVSGSTASALQVTADLTQCKGVDGHVNYSGFNRDNIVRTRILNLSQNPNATLSADTISLPADAASGRPVDVSGNGNFTLKGKTNPVSFKLKGQAEGDQKLEIAGSFTVNLSDYGISVPSVPFTSAGNTGTVEVDLFLTK